jgi:hypothetical protein
MNFITNQTEQWIDWEKKKLIRKELSYLIWEMKDLHQLSPALHLQRLLQLETKVQTFDRLWDGRYIESVFDVKLHPLELFITQEIERLKAPKQSLLSLTAEVSV